MMEHKIIEYFSRSTDTLKRLLILNILQHGNQMGYLVKDYIKHIAASDNSLAPELNYIGVKLKQDLYIRKLLISIFSMK